MPLEVMIEVMKVDTSMLPEGRWWFPVPSSLAGRPMILTSDPERFAKAIVDWQKARDAKAEG